MSPRGQVGEASDIMVGEIRFDPAAGADRKAPEAGDKYKNYTDDVILTQWATVISKEHIIRVGDPKST